MPTPTCTECKLKLARVQILDRRSQLAETRWSYVANVDPSGTWFGHLPVEGDVMPFMCSHCGRISFHAQPRERGA